MAGYLVECVVGGYLGGLAAQLGKDHAPRLAALVKRVLRRRR
ncbi:hypothetical protein AB5J62_33660 [Amycolatopsis sp. cg5]